MVLPQRETTYRFASGHENDAPMSQASLLVCVSSRDRTGQQIPFDPLTPIVDDKFYTPERERERERDYGTGITKSRPLVFIFLATESKFGQIICRFNQTHKANCPSWSWLSASSIFRRFDTVLLDEMSNTR